MKIQKVVGKKLEYVNSRGQPATPHYSRTNCRRPMGQPGKGTKQYSGAVRVKEGGKEGGRVTVGKTSFLFPLKGERGKKGVHSSFN